MTREALTHFLPHLPHRVTARPAATWQYRSKRRSLGIYWLAILVSTGVHVLVLFGFNRKPKPVHATVASEAVEVTIAMPDLKDLEEPEKVNVEDDMAPPDPGVPVPTLPDVPTQVDLSTAFVQQIDYNSLVPPPELSAAQTITIPKNISRGAKIGEGMKNLFNLAELDRAPVPVVQVKPTTPPSLRRVGGTAEVKVAFIVDTEGRVVQPTVLSSTDNDCESSALIAVSKWKFRPGMKGGRKVNTRMMQPIIFTVMEGD